MLANNHRTPQPDPHDHDGTDPDPAPRADARTALTALAFAVQPSLALFLNDRSEDSHSYGALL